MYKELLFNLEDLDQFKLDEKKFNGNYYFWQIENNQLFVTQVINGERISQLADWICCELTIKHENRKQIPIINKSSSGESYDFIIEIEKGFITNKYIKIISIDDVLSHNIVLNRYYDNKFHISQISLNNFNHNKEKMKGEIMSFFLNLNLVHKDKTLNVIQQYITEKITNYLDFYIKYSFVDESYKVELYSQIIKNIDIVVNEKLILCSFNNDFNFDTSIVVENYIKYLNECFIKKNDFIHINDSSSKIIVLDFEYIKWAIRNLKWFILSPSFFKSRLNVSQIVDIKNTSNLLYEFNIKENYINVKDYLNGEDYKLNLLKQNIIFDIPNAVYTFKNLEKNSFLNYLMDDNVTYDIVSDNTDEWGLIGKIIYELSHNDEDYECNDSESASDKNWLEIAAGTNDPQIMNDVYWNLD